MSDRSDLWGGLAILFIALGIGGCNMMDAYGTARVIEAKANAALAEKRLELELTKAKTSDTVLETIEKEDDLNK